MNRNALTTFYIDFDAPLQFAIRYLGRNPRANHAKVSQAVRHEFASWHLEKEQTRLIVDEAYRRTITPELPAFEDDGE